MKFLDEYRDPSAVQALAAAIRARVTRPWVLMEICGGQTHAILRFGLDQLLPSGVELVHGPGCPVCVTPTEALDRAIELARTPGVTLCTFADMLRVPGARGDLYTARAEGADVRIVHSPLDAVALARQTPSRHVTLFAVGFETTAPTYALAVTQARAAGLDNFSLLASLVLVPPAMEALLDAADNRVQAFLAAGHVCAVMGTGAYGRLAERFGVPIVVTGFEPVDLLQGVLMAVEQLESGRAEVEVAYARAVPPDGNPTAAALVAEVFEVVDKGWRGLGTLPRSGLGLRACWADFDAERRFPAPRGPEAEPALPGPCIAGDILRGVRRPPECSAFGTDCRPERPLGAPMVSSEGACAAWFRYRAARPRGDEA
jgi:hydrogenase expression/formation protein HypD